jgi:hypothetical protein
MLMEPTGASPSDGGWARGVSPYLRAFVIARINPALDPGDPPPLEEVLKTMRGAGEVAPRINGKTSPRRAVPRRRGDVF